MSLLIPDELLKRVLSSLDQLDLTLATGNETMQRVAKTAEAAEQLLIVLKHEADEVRKLRERLQQAIGG